MNTAGWQRWRAAEAALGQGAAALDAAAATLPPRQAAILRALDALARGTPAEITACAEACPERDVQVVLQLTTVAPSSYDPAWLRVLWRREGIPNKPFQRLDLLRLFATELKGATIARSAAVAKAARGRPVFEATLATYWRKRGAAAFGQALAERSLRLAETWTAAMAVALDQTGEPVELTANGEFEPHARAETFPPERWPAAHRSRQNRGSAGSVSALERWLATPEARPFDDDCEDACNDVQSRAEQQRLLARLLHAIARLLRLGRAPQALDPIEVALEIADEIASSDAERVLARQLEQLALRVSWWASPDLQGRQARGAWSVVRGLPPAERSLAAKVLLERVAPGQGPAAPIAEMLEAVFVDPSNLDLETGAHLLQMADTVKESRLRSALAGAEAWHAELVLATHALGRGADTLALERAVAGWTAPAPSGPASHARGRTEVAGQIVRQVASDWAAMPGSDGGRTKRDREQVALALGRLCEGLERDLPDLDEVGPSVLEALVRLAPRLRGLGRPPFAPDRVVALARLKLTELASAGASDIDTALLAVGLEDTARAEAVFQGLGRRLRTAPKPEATALALGWIVEVRKRLASPHALFARWAKALDAFLKQDDPERIGSAALALASESPPFAADLLAWAGESLEPARTSGHWDEIEQIAKHLNALGALLDPARGGLEEMMEEFGLPPLDSLGPGGLEELRASLHDLIENFGGGLPGLPDLPGPRGPRGPRRKGGRRG